jgi:hypothetical protein
MRLDEFLEAQGRGVTVTLQAIPDRPDLVRVTPHHGRGGCGCGSSFDLPRTMIVGVKGTGTHHFCCGKRLEVAIVEFAEDAAVPVAELMKPRTQHHRHRHRRGPRRHGRSGEPDARGMVGRRRAWGTGDSGPRPVGPPGGGPVALVGRWRIPWTRCTVSCIEVCTRFCGPTGWDCCGWETRCAVNCDGPYYDPFGRS